tara:strand:- start:2561 stop:2761 length:201 start_codon:yes stop_codon:yes gene_type:complete
MEKKNSILIRVHPEFAKLLKEMGKDIDGVTKTRRLAEQLKGVKFETNITIKANKGKKKNTNFKFVI